MRPPAYLGDSVYVIDDSDVSGGVILTTRNGLPTDPSNTIVLEPCVLDQLFTYWTLIQKDQS